MFSHSSAPTEIYTLSLHDALPIFGDVGWVDFRRHPDHWLEQVEAAGGILSINHPLQEDHAWQHRMRDRKSTRLNSSHVAISYAVFCLKKKIQNSYILPLMNTKQSD